MEKGLVILLLCCAGALVADSMPTEEQQERFLERLQQELASAKASHYSIAENQAGFPTNPDDEEIRNLQIENVEEQEIGFPTNPVEQQTETAKEQKSRNNGVVYTRWGSTECPKTATRVYMGRAAGAYYSHTGTAANYICLPDNPEYYSSTKKATYAALVYGSEYATWASPLNNLGNHNVPCAVCYAARNAMIMVPAKITCPSKWTREYNGYLMAAYYKHASPKNFVCVDIDAQPVRGEEHDTNGALFYHARVGNCRGIDCPPYNTKKDLACVVCTR